MTPADLLRADLRLVVSLVPEGSRVLDLGCGDGELLKTLRDEKGAFVRGVELDRVEARLLDPPGRLGEEVHQLEDLGDRRLADLLALLLGVLVDDLVPGRPGQLEDAVRGTERVVARDRALAARVLQLVWPPFIDVVAEEGHQVGRGCGNVPVRRIRAEFPVLA